MFDTQAAYAVLHPGSENVCKGLNVVLNEYAQGSNELKKQVNHRNWHHRPLPLKMIEYAVQDVTYLHTASRKMVAELSLVEGALAHALTKSKANAGCRRPPKESGEANVLSRKSRS